MTRNGVHASDRALVGAYVPSAKKAALLAALSRKTLSQTEWLEAAIDDFLRKNPVQNGHKFHNRAQQRPFLKRAIQAYRRGMPARQAAAMCEMGVREFRRLV